MIGLVTWPPFLLYPTLIINKGGQVTKPIIVVKIPFKLQWLAMYFSGIKEF